MTHKDIVSRWAGDFCRGAGAMSTLDMLFIDKRRDAFVSLQTVRRNVVEVGGVHTARRRYE
jgi:hypothetical protein